MSDEKKKQAPQEFWIMPERPGHLWGDCICDIPMEGFLHVIEIAALTELQKEKAQLESDIADLYFAHNESCKENEKLKADLAKYKEQVFVAFNGLKVEVTRHKQAYDLDIFPNSEFLDDNSSRDSVSAKMGRHMCDCFIRYIDEALAKIGAGDK